MSHSTFNPQSMRSQTPIIIRNTLIITSTHIFKSIIDGLDMKAVFNVVCPFAVYIDRASFSNLKNLRYFYAPELIEVDEGAFGNCSNLRKVFGQKIAQIRESGFNSCLNLGEISLKKLKSLEKLAFYCCALQFVECPQCASCHQKALGENRRLESVDFPLVEEFTEYSVYSVRQLRLPKLANLVKIKGLEVTEDSSALLKLGNKVIPQLTAHQQDLELRINWKRFLNGQNFNKCEEMLVCDSVKPTRNFQSLKFLFCSQQQIPTRTFENLKLQQVVLPQTTIIHQNAFSDCYFLSKVVSPQLQEIQESAFFRCHGLAEIGLSKVERVGRCAFFQCTSLIKVKMPMVRQIPESCFEQSGVMQVIARDAIADKSSFKGCNCLFNGEEMFLQELYLDGFHEREDFRKLLSGLKMRLQVLRIVRK